MAQTRLQKILAEAGLGSRRAAEGWLAAGRVAVNGRVARVGERADAASDDIRLDGRPLPAPVPAVVLALHKPFGFVTTLRDPQGRPTLRDLLPAAPRLVPVGRLDIDSEGLLLCTNDGGVVQAVAHPSGGVRKRYRAWVGAVPSPAALAALRRGVVLDDGPARALEARALSLAEGGCGLDLEARAVGDRARAVVEVVMAEGRKREVRRLLAAVHLPVVRLVRVAVGTVTLTGLGPGRYRYLSEREMAALMATGSATGRARARSASARPPGKPRPANGSEMRRAKTKDDGSATV